MKVKCVVNNLIFNDQDEVFAAYVLPEMQYQFLKQEDKFQKLMRTGSVVEDDTNTHVMLMKISTPKSIDFLGHEQSLFHEYVTAVEEAERDIIQENTNKGSTENLFLTLIKLDKSQLDNWKEKGKYVYNKAVEIIRFNSDDTYTDFHKLSKNYVTLFESFEQTLFLNMSGYKRATELQIMNTFRHIQVLDPLPSYSVTKFEDDENIYIPQNMVSRYVKGWTNIFNPRYLKFYDSDMNERYVAYFTLSSFDSIRSMPGHEYLYHLESLEFHVDYSISVNILNNEEAKKKVGSKKNAISDQQDQNMQAGAEDNKTDEDAEMIKSQHDHLRRDRQAVMLESKIIIRVEATSKQEIQNKSRMIKNHMKSIGVILDNPFGDQKSLHEQFFPGQGKITKDYVQYSNSDFISGSGHGLGDSFGNKKGFLIGYAGVQMTPIYFDPSRAAQSLDFGALSAPGIKITGATGGGKSMLANLIAFLIGLYGGKVLILDLKNERWRWKKYLPKNIADEVDIVTIGADTGGRENNDEGTLDPFLLEDKPAIAVERAVATIQTILKMEVGGRQAIVLKEVLSRVAEASEPGMNKIFPIIKAISKGEMSISNEVSNIEFDMKYREAAHELYISLEKMRKMQLTRLLFSNGKKDELTTISYKKTYTMLQFSGLSLPKATLSPSLYTEEQVVSVALMNLIQLFTKGFMFSDDKKVKCIVNEEAWSLLGNETGAAIVDDSVLLARSTNTVPLIVTQNETHEASKLNNNIGTFFYGQANDLDEIHAIAKSLDISDEEAKAALMNLSQGEFLSKDIYGHISRVKIHVPFGDWYQAFDTSAKGFGTEQEEKIT